MKVSTPAATQEGCLISAAEFYFSCRAGLLPSDSSPRFISQPLQDCGGTLGLSVLRCLEPRKSHVPHTVGQLFVLLPVVPPRYVGCLWAGFRRDWRSLPGASACISQGVASELDSRSCNLVVLPYHPPQRDCLQLDVEHCRGPILQSNCVELGFHSVLRSRQRFREAVCPRARCASKLV